jgi:ketosteroid isomerase-like protein
MTMGSAPSRESKTSETSQMDPKVLLDRFYDAEVRYMNAGGAAAGADFSEVAACLHPDVVFRHGPSVPYPGDWQGVDGVARLFEAMSETWSYLDFQEVNYFYNATGVAIKLKGVLRSRATGKSVAGEAGQFVIVTDGLIKDWTTFFLDPVGLSEACKPPASPTGQARRG